MALRLIPDNVNINFIQYGKVTLLLSGILTILLPLFIFIYGINLGVDFTGGILMEVKSEENFSIADVNKQLIEKGFTGFTAQNLKSNHMVIRFKDDRDISNEVLIKKIKEALEEKLKGITYRKIDYVGPQVSSKQIVKGVISIVTALIGIFFYIWFRFNWQFSLGSTIALVHDVVLVLWFISITNIEFNLSSIAALLTVIGYSINDSVIIYDRIRENLKKLKNKPLQEIINTSINSTLSRTVLTSGTTLLASIPLMLICTGTVKDFSTIIFFGVLAGTYSSIFISAPVLIYNKKPC
ncbi:protein translocase subunit SecF [Candidatus Mesenet endosymbiont of Phosphuga atrata]|uniref:protein translocase subunit SecF n=1 Tax=Candidatus Mesenet endosymbiont of Phosphuga atrata TaxID=3066221 RepID=UPI0030D3DBC8